MNFYIGLIKMKVHEKQETWDELKVVTTLDEYRQQQALNKGASFSTIAGPFLFYSLFEIALVIIKSFYDCLTGFGPNGAIIHYRPTPITNRIIDNSSLLILDSGGQYLGNFSRPRNF